MATFLKLLLFSLTCWCGSSAKKAPASDRSYQIGVPVVNSAQGIQFYASSGAPGLLYPNVAVPAAVYIPGQVGVLNLPSGLSQVPSVSGTPDSTPPYGPTYSPPRPSYTPYSPQQQSSSPSFSIEQSVDLTDSTPPPTYGPPKTVDMQYRRPHVHRTYHRTKGHSHPTRMPRPPTGGRPTYYTHMHKGHYHTHYLGPSPSYHKSPKPSYLPSSSPSTTPAPRDEISPPLYNPHANPSTEAPQQLYNHHAHPSPEPPQPLYSHPSPEAPQQLYSRPSPAAPQQLYSRPSSEPPQQLYSRPSQASQELFSPSTESPHHVFNHHAHPSGSGSSGSNLVRFPSSASHSDLTQANLGQSGVINNYDATLPVKIPKPKPNQLEVKEILKNADLHFVDVIENLPPSKPAPQTVQGQTSYTSGHAGAYSGINLLEQRYPISQLYSPQQEDGQQSAAYQAFLQHHQQSTRPEVQGFKPYAELYDQRYQVSSNFQSNHLEQEPGKSETVKIPVAVFKGIVPSMFPSLQVKRSDNLPTTMESKSTSSFVPSKSTSDWIPVTGVPKAEKLRNLNQFGDDYFADLHRQSNAAEESKKTDPKTFFNEPSASNQKFSPSKQENLVGNPVVYGTSQPSSSGGSFFDNQGSSSDNFFTSKPADDEESDIISGSYASHSGSSGSGGSFRDYPMRSSEVKKSEKVGDIISGRIPGDHNPFATLGSEGNGGVRDRRVITGKITDGGSTSSANFGDSSNLVVSSVIKFSR